MGIVKNKLRVNQVVIPDNYIKIQVYNVEDIPLPEEGEAIMYEDFEGVVYCFFEGGVYIKGDLE